MWIPAILALTYAHHLPTGRRWRETLLSLAPCATIVAAWFVSGESPPFPVNVLGVSLLVAAAIQLWPAPRTGRAMLAGL